VNHARVKADFRLLHPSSPYSALRCVGPK